MAVNQTTFSPRIKSRAMVSHSNVDIAFNENNLEPPTAADQLVVDGLVNVTLRNKTEDEVQSACLGLLFYS